MGLEDRVRNVHKREKHLFYTYKYTKDENADFNDVWLYIARLFKIPVKQVKAIVYPNNKPHFGGGE